MSLKTLTVPLTSPISVRGEVVDSLTFREPTLGDLIAAERSEAKGTHENSLILMACMAGIQRDEMEKISYADYLALDAALQPLMGNGGAAASGESSPS